MEILNIGDPVHYTGSDIPTEASKYAESVLERNTMYTIDRIVTFDNCRIQSIVLREVDSIVGFDKVLFSKVGKVD